MFSWLTRPTSGTTAFGSWRHAVGLADLRVGYMGPEVVHSTPAPFSPAAAAPVSSGSVSVEVEVEDDEDVIDLGLLPYEEVLKYGFVKVDEPTEPCGYIYCAIGEFSYWPLANAILDARLAVARAGGAGQAPCAEPVAVTPAPTEPPREVVGAVEPSAVVPSWYFTEDGAPGFVAGGVDAMLRLYPGSRFSEDEGGSTVRHFFALRSDYALFAANVGREPTVGALLSWYGTRLDIPIAQHVVSYDHGTSVRVAPAGTPPPVSAATHHLAAPGVRAACREAAARETAHSVDFVDSLRTAGVGVASVPEAVRHGIVEHLATPSGTTSEPGIDGLAWRDEQSGVSVVRRVFLAEGSPPVLVSIASAAQREAPSVGPDRNYRVARGLGLGYLNLLDPGPAANAAFLALGAAPSAAQLTEWLMDNPELVSHSCQLVVDHTGLVLGWRVSPLGQLEHRYDTFPRFGADWWGDAATPPEEAGWCYLHLAKAGARSQLAQLGPYPALSVVRDWCLSHLKLVQFDAGLVFSPFGVHHVVPAAASAADAFEVGEWLFDERPGLFDGDSGAVGVEPNLHPRWYSAACAGLTASGCGLAVLLAQHPGHVFAEDGGATSARHLFLEPHAAAAALGRDLPPEFSVGELLAWISQNPQVLLSGVAVSPGRDHQLCAAPVPPSTPPTFPVGPSLAAERADSDELARVLLEGGPGAAAVPDVVKHVARLVLSSAPDAAVPLRNGSYVWESTVEEVGVRQQLFFSSTATEGPAAFFG
jgi:hypothetical protein